MTDTLDRIRGIIARQMNIAEAKIRPNSKFIDDLGMDELERVDFTMSVEDEFYTEISDETAEGFRTVADVVKHLENLKLGVVHA